MASALYQRPIFPSSGDLFQVFLQKHGEPSKVGPVPRRRHAHGYYLPADFYEALVANLVVDGCAWVDVGGGHQIFPENPGLSRQLVDRCSTVVAVDPSDNVHRNPFVHERAQSFIEDYRPERCFDLATLRMVVEHVSKPAAVVRALHGLMKPGGVVVVLTVNRWSPVSLASRIVPFALHHYVKRVVWGGEEEDTFPVCYLMNTRRQLSGLFQSQGFREVTFSYLDDLSSFGALKGLGYAELLAWKMWNRTGLRYPENCLLGVYEKLPVS